nr:MAG TPA: hypothetical protein [Caudoviricetes sp.]
MPVLQSNPITIIDSLDNINLELFVSSNLPLSQVLDSTGSISPSWVKTPLVLTPSVYVRNRLVKNPVISWQRRSGGGTYTSQLVSGEFVVNGVLTVNKDLLATDPNKIITYKCTVQYGTISHSIETSFSFNALGIEQGTANGWTYRKWENGMAECWRKIDFQGSITMSDLTIDLPFTFASNDYLVQLTPSINGSIVNKYYVGDKMANEGRTTTHLKIAHQTDDDSSSVLYFIYVTGLWK